MNITSNCKFGWTERNRPDYEIKLTERDIRNGDIEQAVPTDTFVEKVAEKLVGDEDSAPRFVLLSDAKEAFGQETKDSRQVQERVKLFRRNLMEQLVGYFRRHNPDLLTLKNPLSNDPPLNGEKVRVNLAAKMDDPYPRHKDKSGTISPMFTHWDYYYWPIISMQYGKPENVMGGLPRVFDARQMARDEGKDILDLVDREKFRESKYASLHPPASETFEKYSIPFDPEAEPILIINNTLDAGIGHGVTTVYPRQLEEPVSRPIHHMRVVLTDPAKTEKGPSQTNLEFNVTL